MIKLLAVGIWVVCVTLGASYAVSTFFAPESKAEVARAEASYYKGLDYRKTTNITVPMIDERKIRGYVLAQFVYTIDGGLASDLAVPPDPLVVDAAFRRIYSAKAFDFDEPHRFDLDELLSDVKASVNERYDDTVVHDVMVEQFDYIPRENIRGRRPETD